MIGTANGAISITGIGAYVMVLLWNYGGVTPWVGIPVAIVVSIIVALLVGYPCFHMRITGHYFALLTLALSEFVRLCTPHMVGRWAHPESVCGCLHDYAAATVEDADLREALLRGISETGVPTIETAWVPPSKQSEIGPTFTKIAKPTLQCMFEPATNK